MCSEHPPLLCRILIFPVNIELPEEETVGQRACVQRCPHPAAPEPIRTGPATNVLQIHMLHPGGFRPIPAKGM